jgi:hypothetical protein
VKLDSRAVFFATLREFTNDIFGIELFVHGGAAQIRPVASVYASPSL